MPLACRSRTTPRGLGPTADFEPGAALTLLPSCGTAYALRMSVLQSHLYSQFLSGSAADVALHVRGSWESVYHVRMPSAPAHVTILTSVAASFTASFSSRP